MAVLDIQRRGQQIGRIRLGQQVKAKNSDKMRPAKLDTFRFTTASRTAADAIAELYGGEVRKWEREWEVITSRSEIGVIVPPRDQVVSQWYEMWSAGGCQRRCDSQHEQISNGPCLCPHADDPDDEEAVAEAALKRAELSKLVTPQACKLITRISVMIPDLPGLGIFRLDSHSYYAATEIGDSAALMQMARDQGVMIPAILRIEQRKRVSGGQTKNYPVPVLEVLATFRQIASGALGSGGITAQLPPAPGETRKAITAGPATVAPAAAPEPEAPPAEDEAFMEDWERATVIYQRARATTTAAQFTACVDDAKRKGLLDAQVCISSQDDTWADLQSALQDAWRDKGRGAA